MNCSNDSWKEDLVVLSRCQGRRRRRRRRKRVEKLSGSLIERAEWLLTKQFVHLIWIAKIEYIKLRQEQPLSYKQDLYGE